MDNEQARKSLQRLAEHLREQKLPSRPNAKPVKWATDAADAIESFLDGKVASLDIAFGVKRGRGRPLNPDIEERDKQIALDVFRLKLDGKPLSDNSVGDGAYTLIGEKYELSSKTIENIYSNYLIYAMSEEVFNGLLESSKGD